MENETIKIASLELENVKRVRAVSLEPAENGLTVIGGRNGQGKTSVLDGIAYALGGEKFRPSALQNAEGMNPARMEVVLSNGLKVVRSGKNAALKVIDPSGAKSGQKLLDSFIDEFALNLPKFMQMDDRGKGKILLHTLGIEDKLEALDREEQKAYDERKLQNLDADRKAKYAAELPEFPDVPEEPLSAADMSAQLTAALAENAKHQALRNERANLQEKAKQAAERVDYLRRQLDDAEKAKADVEEELKLASEPIPEDIDVTAMQKELEEIDAINAKVRTNLDKAKALDVAREAKELAAILDGKVEEVRARRKALLDSVKMPLPGLSVEQGLLVYKGQRWDCMSTMEQYTVAIAICRQLRPLCGFVLLDRLESFDAEQLKALHDRLVTYGMQGIATRVSTGDECSIIIEDGMVSGETAAENNSDDDIGGF